MQRLKETGVGGLVAYGMLNALYYTVAAVVVWHATGGGHKLPSSFTSRRIDPIVASPATHGIKASANRFVKVLTIVWAGSQVTKAARIAGSIVLAPAISQFLSWVQKKFGFKTPGQAAGATAGALIVFTMLVFGSLVLGGAGHSPVPCEVSLGFISTLTLSRAVLPPASRLPPIASSKAITKGSPEELPGLALWATTSRRPPDITDIDKLDVDVELPLGQEELVEVLQSPQKHMSEAAKGPSASKEVTPPTTTGTSTHSLAPSWLGDVDEGDLFDMDDMDVGAFLDEEDLVAQYPPKKTKSSSPRRMKVERRDQTRAIRAERRRAKAERKSPSTNTQVLLPTDEGKQMGKITMGTQASLSVKAKSQGNKEEEVRDPSPNPNVHGWNQHPEYLRGRWAMTSLNVTAHQHTALIQEFSEAVKCLVLKGNSTLKLLTDEQVGPVDPSSLSPIGWEFTPANRRMVMEVYLPHHDVVLRFSGQVARRPGYYCKATGVIRLRPVDAGRYSPHRRLPSSDVSWPRIATFNLDKVLPPRKKPEDPFQQILVWAGVQPPPLKAKVADKLDRYLGPDKPPHWNRRVLEYKMWKYFQDSNTRGSNTGSRSIKDQGRSPPLPPSAGV